jgi:hypothetical protein
MTNFKLSKRDALSDTRSSVNELHEKKMDYFEKENKNLNNYIEDLNNLKCKNDIKSKKKFLELEKKIQDIKNDNERTQYLLDLFKILEKHNISMKDFDNNKKDGKIENFINYSVDNSKIKLYNEYIKKFNPELKAVSIDTYETNNICSNCNSDKFIYDQRLSEEICLTCGLSKTILINYQDNSVNYLDTNEQIFIFNYKRNNHFQECLNQLQAKENTTIPPKIIEDLTKEFKKYNIIDPKLFTPSLVKSYLKKLKYNKYYEHIPTIINEFCGLKAPKMTPELEQQLKIMFDEIQTPFEKYSNIICPNRKNFLNYNYVLYKMCELLNKDEFLSCFPLLKNREILYQHDLIWKGICNDCRWEFIPSI